MVNKVKKIKRGDYIGLFSPSEPLTEERQTRMKESISILESNFKLIWAKNSLKNTFYQAGTREERIDDIKELLDNPDVSAIMATWGGKNGNQLVSNLPYDLLSKRRIPVIGFSDTCVLLNPISVFSDIITFYGPNIAGKLQESEHYDLTELCGGEWMPFGNKMKESWVTIRDGKTDGFLYGGNLSTFTIGLSGNDCLKKMHDIIFFWESAGDPPQIIDQYLSGLENSGFFKSVKAMIVGQTFYNEEERKNRPLNELLREYGDRYDIPVIKMETFGHSVTENPIIPIGAHVTINTDTKSIDLDSSIVE